MSVYSATDAAACLTPRSARLPISEPVVFDTFTGSFQAAPESGGPPVLMLSPFGYEELCGRAFWAALADRLAAAGVPSLRFDFPGTANALDTKPDGIEDWRMAAMAAAKELRVRTGQTRIAILGQSLGATLGLHWSVHLGPLAAIALLEPAASGRAYLRGLKAWGATVATASGLPSSAAASDYSVAGFSLPENRAAAIRALDIGQIDIPLAADVLVLEQPGGPAGKLLAKRLGSNGTEVVYRPFPGYAGLVTDPTSARVPTEAMVTVVDWLSARCPVPPRDKTHVTSPSARVVDGALLLGEGFAERPVRFGPGASLAGVLCLPQAAEPGGSAVVLVNAGRDHSIGWARSAVVQARALAQQGVASLRFDIGGVGDSRASVDAPDEVLYSKHMCDDLRTAVDYLDGLGYRSLGLVGRCSGAWAAFTLAVGDPRIRRLALINTGYFLWDESKSLADIIRFAQRNVGDLGAILLRRDGLHRLLAGELDLRGAWRFLLRQANRHLLRRHAPLLGRLTAESRRYHDLHAVFTQLRARNVPVLLAYSEGDSSLNELRSFMGQNLGRLDRYPSVSVCTVTGADHNFTPQRANAELLARLVPFLRTVEAPDWRRHATRLEVGANPKQGEPYVLVSSQV